MTRKARVKAGRLVVDEPTDLPEGTEVELLPLDPGDWLGDEDRAAHHKALLDSEGAAREDVRLTFLRLSNGLRLVRVQQQLLTRMIGVATRLIALQEFESISRRHHEIIQARGGVNEFQLSLHHTPQNAPDSSASPRVSIPEQSG
jgi:hypothetical protein